METVPWKVLILDNEPIIHEIINTTLLDTKVYNRPINVFHAHSAAEARAILKEHPDICVAFIDIMIDTPQEDLQLVSYIRQTLQNELIRIVLVASESSPMPARELIEHYDINDYKDKEDVIPDKLYTAISIAIKQYSQFLELQKNRQELYEQLTHNEITNLPNRIKLYEKLDSVGNKSLVLLNIDNFGQYNVAQGFAYGDELLRVFADFLTENYADKMDIFHLNADIFAMLCYEEDPREVDRCVDGIKYDISRHTFDILGNKIRLTASLGVVLNEDGNLIQKAEFALKEARLYSRNNVAKYSDDLNIIRTVHANSLWSQRIREAFEKGNVCTYYQAIKNIRTNTISKYEALVRLEYNGKIYSPFAFLDAALYSGQLFDIFQLMLENICKKAQTTSVSFSINASQYDLNEPDFKSFLQTTLQKYNIDPQRITLEILEYTSISNKEAVQQLLREIHEYGCKIAIDDFGTECSNFAQLNNIPIDFIKIDGEFIKDIITDTNSQIVTRTITDFAHQKGIPIIAEFVCTGEICEYIKILGIEYAQGYEIAEPKPELI